MANLLKKVISLEQRKKISETRKARMASGKIPHPRGMLGKKHSQLTKVKMSQKRIGRKYTAETIKRMSDARINFYIAHPEQRELRRKLFSGSNSNFWKGGSTEKSKIIRSSSRYKDWRMSVFKRDNFTCQECGIRGGIGKKVILNADHIKPFALYPELRFSLENGRTLCLSCHKKTPTWGGMSKFKKKSYV